MRIWIFNHYAVGPGQSGGTRHYDLSKRLVKRGHSVRIFASSFNYQSRMDNAVLGRKTYAEDNFAGVRFTWIRSHRYHRNDIHRVLNMFSYTVRSFLVASHSKERPDLVIGSLMHPFAALVGYLVAKRKKSKFYFEVRDLWPQSMIDLGKVTKKNVVVRLLKRLELFLYRKADRIILLFDKADQYIIRQGISKEKLLYVPNGVDLERFDSSETQLSPELKRFFDEKTRKFTAVYTGAHGLANNLDIVLDAAKKLGLVTGIHFLFIGDGPEKERLQDRVTKEGIPNVSFYPSVPKEMIPEILRRANVGLLPLQNSPVFRWGISPNKLFDYMASALPIILICNLPDTPVSYSGGGYVVTENSSDQLMERLRYFYENPEMAREMGGAARAYVERHHSWDRLSDVLIEAIGSDVKNDKKVL